MSSPPSSIQVISRSRSVRQITSPVSVKTLCAEFSATVNLSREILGRVLCSWVAELAGTGLTWLRGTVDSTEAPTSSDSGGESRVLTCACQCHCGSGGVVIACLCLSIGLSVGLFLPFTKPDSLRYTDAPEGSIEVLSEASTPAVNDQTLEVSTAFRRARCPP